MTQTEQDDLEALLDRRGPHALLAWLNARTRFRFTGLYRVDGASLHTLALFDRENPELALSGGVTALAETCCAIVAETGQGFATGEAAADPRLAGRAARLSAVQAYLGVALREPTGCTWGTLCHYDLRPRLAPTGELPTLERAARLFAARLLAARLTDATRGLSA